MHALLVSVSIDPARQSEVEANLHEGLVPMVKSLPGFVAGYWLRPEAGQALSVMIFDTEEHARAGSPPAGATPNLAVTIDRVECREVAARA